MSAGQTDTIRANKERGLGRVLLSPDDKVLIGLDSATDELVHRSNRLVLALRGATIGRLNAVFENQIRQLNVDGALRVSAELTARGIAPCFRLFQRIAQQGAINYDVPVLTVSQRRELESEGSVIIRGDGPSEVERQGIRTEVDFILMAADLQWIVSRYPNHVPEWNRASGIFDPKKFRKTATFLYWDGQRTGGQVAKALALSEEQQRECGWIQCLHVERWRKRLFHRFPVAEARIASAVRESDKRPRADQDVTIKRRCDLWLCAELAGWKPQRTAALYAAMTGETLPRNVVGKQLTKLPRVRRADGV